MLVLSRKVGETIVISGPCVITYVGIGRGKIGITADPNVKIVRGELIQIQEKGKDNGKQQTNDHD